MRTKGNEERGKCFMIQTYKHSSDSLVNVIRTNMLQSGDLKILKSMEPKNRKKYPFAFSYVLVSERALAEGK